MKNDIRPFNFELRKVKVIRVRFWPHIFSILIINVCRYIYICT